MALSLLPVGNPQQQLNNLSIKDELERLNRSSAFGAAPVSPAQGQVWYDTVNSQLKVWNGSAWVVPGGTVTSITAGTGLSGGTITTTGTISLTAPVTEALGGTNQTTYALGDLLYSSAANTLSKLGGNTTAIKKFLRQTGTGTVSAAPAWDTIVASDIPTLNQDTTGKSAKTDALNSATTVVNVAAATAPSLGQVLTATDSTHATWQTPSAGAGDMLKATYDPANIGMQLVGTTASQTLSSKTLTTPIIGQINDTNGNEMLLMTPVASAVNYFTIGNNSSGLSPTLTAAGTGTNLNVNLIPKGSGNVTQNGTVIPTISSTNAITNKDLTSGTNTFPTFNQNTTGTAAGLSATLGVGSGGSGAATFTAGYLKSPGTTSAFTTVASIPASDITASAWTTYTPTWTGSSANPALGNGTIAGRYMQIGKTVFFSIVLTMGSTTTYGTGTWSFTLPVTKSSSAPARDPLGQAECLQTGTASYTAQSISFTTTTTDVQVYKTGGTYTNGAQITSAIPFTWGNTHVLSLQGTYEAA